MNHGGPLIEDPAERGGITCRAPNSRPDPDCAALEAKWRAEIPAEIARDWPAEAEAA
jgi:hypothetical protein